VLQQAEPFAPGRCWVLPVLEGETRAERAPAARLEAWRAAKAPPDADLLLTELVEAERDVVSPALEQVRAYSQRMELALSEPDAGSPGLQNVRAYFRWMGRALAHWLQYAYRNWSALHCPHDC
jgi:hypothetical protein